MLRKCHIDEIVNIGFTSLRKGKLADMPILRRTGLIVMIFATLTAWTSEKSIDRYTQLKKEGIYDPSMSSDAVNSMLSKGIKSKDPRIVRLSLQALGNFVEFVIFDTPGPFGTLPKRAVHEVPHLKHFLIDHWRAEHARSGYAAHQQLFSDMEQKDDGSLDQYPFTDADVDADFDVNAYWEAMKEKISPWITIPSILVVFWPKDEEVHTLIGEYHENDRSLVPVMMLRLLNFGYFVTPEANEYRNSQLVAYDSVVFREGEPHNADTEIAMAAQGLALSHPEEAIPNLDSSGIEPHASKG